MWTSQSKECLISLEKEDLKCLEHRKYALPPVFLEKYVAVLRKFIIFSSSFLALNITKYYKVYTSSLLSKLLESSKDEVRPKLF